MDPSLADILASVTRAHNAASGEDESEAQRHDLQLLTQAWVAERVAPEVLPYPTGLMERIMDRIRRQLSQGARCADRNILDRKIETIEDSTARMDAGTSFGLIVIQTELERFQFLVRSYLRARVAKIDAHPLHTIAMHDPTLASQAQTQSEQTNRLNASLPLLSPSEASYAQTHAALLERHYTSSFLSSFPQKLRRMDDRAGAGGVSMLEGPDLDKAVFIRCLGVKTSGKRPGAGGDAGFDMNENETIDARHEVEYGPVEVSCGYTTALGEEGMDPSQRDDVRGITEERTEQMRRGDIWIVRWRGVREAVARGECELI